jgi:DNA-binding MarR family transcriptional regulator
MKEEPTLNQLLAKLIEQIELINAKLDLLAQQNTELLKIHRGETQPFFNPQADVMTLLKLPSSLRKTAMALYHFDKATASEIAKATGRSRPVESDCANQLVRMGLANKSRVGMDVYFSIEPNLEA